MENTPVEILQEILAYSLPPINRPQAPLRTTLALVCYRWNAVVQETPIIWSKISSSDKLSQVERSLARSNRHPIDVYGVWSNKYLSHPQEDTLAEIRSFVELANCHMGRWRHVTLEVNSNIPLGPTGGLAPLLESLEVCRGVDSPAVGKPVPLFPRAWTPRLREVCINGLELVRLDMPFPPTLSKLTITGVMYWTISFSKLLTILMACPGLTALELSSHHNDSINDAGWTTLPVVELPALRELTLWKFGTQVIRAILHRLQFPHECAVRLSTWLHTQRPIASLTSTFAHHLDEIHNGGIDQITIAIIQRGFELRAQGARWNMVFNLRTLCIARSVALWYNRAGSTGAEGLTDDLAHRIPVTLEFSQDLHADGTTGSYLFSVSDISDLQCIASLKVDTSQGAHVPILSYLARPITKKGAMRTWSLPGLRELHVKGPVVNLDPVIKFVKTRRGDWGLLHLCIGSSLKTNKSRRGTPVRWNRPHRRGAPSLSC